MKGIIFNLLEEAVTAEFGDSAWYGLVDAAGVSGIYTSLGSYPDEEILALVSVASAGMSTPAEDVLRWFGRKAIPMLAERFGSFFSGHATARSFVRSVNDIIHPEVRKLYSGAGCPHFHFGELPDGRMLIGYQSPRKLCHLAHGFLEGAADHFAESVEVEHVACMMNGSPVCHIAVEWRS